MPRHPRALRVVPGLPHHVIVRGNNKRRLATSRVDRLRFLHLVADAARRWDCLVHWLVLMTNHAHLVIVPPTVVALSLCVQSFCQRYAQRRNRERGATGKLFDERFFSKPIESDAQLAATGAYIELNPPRSGIVATAGDYPWSTYGLHVWGAEQSAVPAELWTPSDWYLSLASTEGERRARYRAFVQSRCDALPPDQEAHRYELEASLRDERRVRRPDETRASETVRNYGRNRRV